MFDRRKKKNICTYHSRYEMRHGISYNATREGMRMSNRILLLGSNATWKPRLDWIWIWDSLFTCVFVTRLSDTFNLLLRCIEQAQIKHFGGGNLFFGYREIEIEEEAASHRIEWLIWCAWRVRDKRNGIDANWDTLRKFIKIHDRLLRARRKKTSRMNFDDKRREINGRWWRRRWF